MVIETIIHQKEQSVRHREYTVCSRNCRPYGSILFTIQPDKVIHIKSIKKNRNKENCSPIKDYHRE